VFGYKLQSLSAWLIFFFFSVHVHAQKETEFQFVKDTMTLNGSDRVLSGEYLEVTLKDQHVVRLFKADDNHVYLRFIVTRNFYFGKSGPLEILSGSKTYTAKNVTQHKVNKTRGLFVTEIFTNYLSTIRDEGMTGLYFNQAETDFSRGDSKKIKRMAKVFQQAYLSATTKKN